MRKTDKVVVDDTIVGRILSTMETRHVTQKGLEEYLGLGNGIFTRWKYDGSKTYMRYIDKISECLGVSRDYLIDGKDENLVEVTITLIEDEIIRMLREMDPKKRELSYQTIKIFWHDSNIINRLTEERR